MTNQSLPKKLRLFSPSYKWVSVLRAIPFIETECLLTERVVHIDDKSYLHGHVFFDHDILCASDLEPKKYVALEVLVDPFSLITVAYRIQSFEVSTSNTDEADQYSWCQEEVQRA